MKYLLVRCVAESDELPEGGRPEEAPCAGIGTVEVRPLWQQ